MTVDIAIDALASTSINGSMVVAAENGIHWRAIREAARLVKAVEAKSTNGAGNLNFATAAMIKPYTPFYPAAWHKGEGKTFAVGLESANVVTEVFAGVHEAGRRSMNWRRRLRSGCCPPRLRQYESRKRAAGIMRASTRRPRRSAMSPSRAPSKTSPVRRSGRAAP